MGNYSRKALSAEKERLGKKEGESLSGSDVLDKYLASALLVRHGDGNIGDVFAQGQQDPAAMARIIREDMKRITDKVDYSKLYDKDDVTAMNAHGGLLAYQMLGDRINEVIEYAQQPGQEKLLEALKPRGRVLPRFQETQKQFGAAMNDMREFRKTAEILENLNFDKLSGDAYWQAADYQQSLRNDLDSLREKRKRKGKPMKQSKKSSKKSKW